MVDLTPTAEEALAQAAEDNCQPGPTSTTLTRAAFWKHYDSALDSFLELARAVHSHQADALPTWVYAAVLGATTDQPVPEALDRIDRIVTATTADLPDDDPSRSAIRRAAANAKAACGLGQPAAGEV